MNTLEQLRDKAVDIELAAVNFLAKDGTRAGKKRAVSKAEFIFIDGTTLVLPKSEIDRREMAGLQFKLRPTQNDG